MAAAVERLEVEQKNGEIAAALRVSVRLVERWRRAWREQVQGATVSDQDREAPPDITSRSSV